MAMTLAEIKRKADAGNMFLELVERFGKSGDAIPEKFRGLRHVLRSASFGLVVETNTGEESRLVINGAKLVEYDCNCLTVYDAGYRELTKAEQNVLEQWNAFQKEYEKKNPYGSGAWVHRKHFFKEKGYPYMDGYETVHGKKYHCTENKVRDTQVRGNVVCKYNVVFA